MPAKRKPRNAEQKAKAKLYMLEYMRRYRGSEDGRTKIRQRQHEVKVINQTETQYEQGRALAMLPAMALFVANAKLSYDGFVGAVGTVATLAYNLPQNGLKVTPDTTTGIIDETSDAIIEE